MNNVFDINENKKTSTCVQGKFKVDYVLDEDKKTVLAVSHPDWNFVITRSEDNKRTAFVMKESNESFGELDSDAFNTVLMSWILIDDPKLIDGAAKT